MYTFIELPIFSRFAADYFTDTELAEVQVALAKTPTLVVDGIRKKCAREYCRFHLERFAGDC